MAADDTHECLTPPDSDGDGRLGHEPDFDEAEWDLGALEREVAAAEFLQLANGHRKICGALHLRYGDVTADEAYLRESILEPTAKIVPGFAKSDAGMPSYAGVLTDPQINALILFIKSLK